MRHASIVLAATLLLSPGILFAQGTGNPGGQQGGNQSQGSPGATGQGAPGQGTPGTSGQGAQGHGEGRQTMPPGSSPTVPPPNPSSGNQRNR